MSERSRTFTWEDPLIGAAAARTLSGLDYLQQMFDGVVPVPPISRLMGMEGVSVAEGRVVFAALPAEWHYNPIGTVHGGFAATLLDSALGCCVHSTLPAGVGYTTLELHLNYVRAITIETGRMECIAEIIYAGRTQATAQARLVDAGGKLYAHGTTTCLMIRS